MEVNKSILNFPTVQCLHFSVQTIHTFEFIALLMERGLSHPSPKPWWSFTSPSPLHQINQR